MPTRQELHALVDTLPEATIEVVHRMLSQLQVWPPRPPSPKRTVAEIQMRGPEGRPVMSSRERWEDGTLIHERMRNHGGHELRIIERIRIESDRLIYKHEITGPGDKHDEREIIFEIS